MQSTTRMILGITLNALYLSLVICVSPLVVYRMFRHGRYRSGWREKLFGRIHLNPKVAADSDCEQSFDRGRDVRSQPAKLSGSEKLLAEQLACKTGTVWFHAVSVGEVQLLRTILDAISIARPNLHFVITSSTDSGYQLAKKLYGEKWDVSYAPMDFTWAIKNAWQRIRPQAVILAELEIWPNWLMYAKKNSCPVLIVNGRLSEKSFAGYRRFRWVLSPMLQAIRYVASQNKTYSERFVELGIPADRVQTTGSIKFDGAEPNRFSEEVQKRRKLLGISSDGSHGESLTDEAKRHVSGDRPNADSRNSEPSANASSSDDSDVAGQAPACVWVAGSTQDPEERLVLDAYLNLLKRHPQLKLILVPRHPERFDAVAAQIEQTGLKWARRTRCLETPPPRDWQIFLGDTVGELRWWWGLADVAFVGGSFGNRGGQNMIEPCAFGVATCFGPNTKNFRDIVQLLLQEKACVQLQSPEELEPWVGKMLSHQETRDSLGNHAKWVAAQHRGALERTVTGLLPWLQS